MASETSGEVTTSEEVVEPDHYGTAFTEAERPQHVTIAGARPMEGLLIGGRVHPLHRDMGCPVCVHHDRPTIERAILDGFSYKSICAKVNRRTSGEEGSRPRLTPAMLERHIRDLHMEFAAAAVRIASDDRLREQGLDPQEVENGMLPDGMALLRATIAQTANRLGKGELQPTMSDALKATQVVAQIEAAQQTTSADDMEAIEEAFAVFWQGVVQITTPEQQGQLALWIQNHPRLAALRAKAEQKPEDPQALAMGEM